MNANHIIDHIGGTSAVARELDLMSGAVSQWRKNGIPVHHERYLRLVHPDAFTTPTDAIQPEVVVKQEVA